MTVTFHFAALTYLNHWLVADRILHADLTAGTTKQKLKALKDGAAQFRIARNLHKQYDIGKGLPRYGPVLEIIDPLTPQDFSDDLIKSIIDIRNQISARYGNRDVLSLTTKLLWLKIRAPIIIYDRQARQALGTANGDFDAYYDAWQAKYHSVRQGIADACSSLVNVLQYTVDTSVATKPYIQSLAEEEWFNQRVFDIYLWHVGNT